jgi:alpha-L-fucosidase
MAACGQPAAPPAPFGALPSEAQLRWHELQYYAFVHFNMNTFTGEEWGHGDEGPDQFFPSELDCRQWARTCKAAGMKGIILTAKHHDGFCLWPSAYSAHTVARSRWREGKGDVLRELSEACREEGLKMGLYLSPWDRNHPAYGSPEYNEVFRGTLREVLTQYGEIFEVWFDGANGEGPGGRKQVYDWPAFIQTVREAQPGAVIFSDAGPDIRWVGNEKGYAGLRNWHTLDRDQYYPGTPRYRELTEGTKRGTHWVPAEADVSIRPGWYYHASEDDSVKSLERLWSIWHGSVGRGANLLLNLPVDRRGKVHPADSLRLMELRQRLDSAYGEDLALGARLRGEGWQGLAALSDGQDGSYAAAGSLSPSAELDFGAPRRVNRVWLEESLAFGQRVDSFAVEAWVGGIWQPLARGSSIGARRILCFPGTETARLRLRILSAMAPPVLRRWSAYALPGEWALPLPDKL